MNKHCREWCKILTDPACGGYYDTKPCRSKTCNLEHQYCKKHLKVMKKIKQNEKSNE